MKISSKCPGLEGRIGDAKKGDDLLCDITLVIQYVFGR